MLDLHNQIFAPPNVCTTGFYAKRYSRTELQTDDIELRYSLCETVVGIYTGWTP